MIHETIRETPAKMSLEESLEEEVTDYVDNFREPLLETDGYRWDKTKIANDRAKPRYERISIQRQFKKGTLCGSTIHAENGLSPTL